MAADRKPHVRVPQERYLDVMQEVDLYEVLLEDIAEHLDVSMATAQRQLDGLVAQGKLELAAPGHARRAYRLVDEPDEPYCVICSHHHEGACWCPDCGRPTPCRTHGVEGTMSTPE